MTKDIIFKKKYEVNSVNININKRLGLFGLLGILQDVGTIHAEHLGVGMESMMKSNNFWVYVQQKLKMSIWPKWQDEIEVVTYPRAIKGLKAYRDFLIFFNGEKIGESVATFMVINGETRRPVTPKLDDSIYQKIPKNVLDFLPEKIVTPEKIPTENIIKVRNSDLDMNNHVNNTKYSQWILDSIPIKYHRLFVVKSFEVNFISEARLGDEIEIKMIINDDGGHEVDCFSQGIRRSDNKIIFASHIAGKKLL